jgi:GDP-mannose 6-dehydrogenase
MVAERKHLSICVLGMGYVGCVTAACLAEEGHRVIGVDVSEVKLNALMDGESPVDEPGLRELIRAGVQAGRLRATADVAAAIQNSDLSLICVGTPSTNAGGLDLSQVERVCEQVGAALAHRAPGHVVVIRSTMLPGSMAKLVRPTLEKHSGKKEGEHFHTAFNPEFLREGTSIKDYRNPPVIVVGTESLPAADVMRRLYRHLQAPFIVVPPAVAEMVKYTANAWHALKITFANEIGEICRAVSVDSHAVMDIFLQDHQLNLSPAYLRPGFAFGGSCLPKDLRALTYFARHHDLTLPVLEHINASNQTLIERVFERIVASGARRVGLYGLSFKPNTDDLRESPLVTLVERLIGKGIEVRIFDENIQVTKLTGANKAYIERHLPHLVQYLVSGFNELEAFAELVVIGHKSPQVVSWARQRNPRIKTLDLARLDELLGSASYEGVSW